MKFLFRLIIAISPWRLRRFILNTLFGYEIDSTARMGWAWVYPKKLKMGPGASIGHGTVVKGLEELVMEENALIGRLNWITGEPMESPSFRRNLNRQPKLHIKREAAITNRHLIDCTDTVKIGEFSIIAGFRSQILTHSIHLEKSVQDCYPIEFGAYCFVGTGVTVLGGSKLPSYSVLGANSLLNRVYEEKYQLYAGVPAKPLKKLSEQAEYFRRKIGFIE